MNDYPSFPSQLSVQSMASKHLTTKEGNRTYNYNEYDAGRIIRMAGW